MDTVPCPGCSTRLELSATVCPVCLRGRNKHEITRGYTQLREEKERRRRRPFLILAWLSAAATVAWFGYRYRAPIAATVAGGRARVSRFIDATLDPKNLLSGPAAAPSPPPPDLTPRVDAPVAPASLPAAPTAPPPKAAKRPAHVADLPIPPLRPTQWAVFGRVYDLATLHPVAGVQLSFSIAGNGDGAQDIAFSDADGRYVLAITRLAQGSYEIHAMKEGYASVALYEADIPYARLSANERDEIVHNAQDGDMALPPLNDVNGEESMRRDVFLAPQR